MGHRTDSYLKHDQYRNSDKLSARVGLHARFSVNPYDWQKWVFDQLDVPRSARILELGSGPGFLWQANGGRVPPEWRIVVSDFSPGMLHEARTMLCALGCQAEFQIIDAQAIPYRDGSFDCVIANHMLYHVPDLPLALREIRRVLTPSGRLYAATNGDAHLKELSDLIRTVVPGFESLAHCFTLENGAERLRRSFQSVDIRRYEDGLVATDAFLLCQYVRSMGSLRDVGEECVQEIERRVREIINAEGQMAIAKDTGLFVAWGRDRSVRER